MKYTQLKFYESLTFETHQMDILQGFKKNKLYDLGYKTQMFVDTDRIELGKQKFKKLLLKKHNGIIKAINNNIN